MLYLVEAGDSQEPRYFALDKEQILVGRSADNDIVLNSQLVSARQAVIACDNGTVTIRSEGLNPIRLNGRDLIIGESCRLRSGDKLFIAGYAFEIFEEQRAFEEIGEARLRAELTDIRLEIHNELVASLYRKMVTIEVLQTEEGRKSVATELDRQLDDRPLFENTRLRSYAAREALRARLLDLVLRKIGRNSARPSAELQAITGDPGLEQEAARITQHSERLLGLARKTASLRQSIRTLRDDYPRFFAQRVQPLPETLELYLARRLLRKEILDLTFGLGPLEDLLDLPNITEIMVVRYDQIYVESEGTLENTGRSFGSEEVSRRIIERIVSRVGRRIDQSTPLVDARLQDGSRVNIVIPPVALRGCAVTIRRFSAQPLTIDDLVRLGALDAAAAALVRAAVAAKKNVVISGGTGSGKTTLLNAVSAFIGVTERIVTIEDNAELQLQQSHVVTLEARAKSVEGAGEIRIRDLVRNALRMRPDRLIVGECRGAEAFDMLQAMNTGHDGSMTTAHANSPRDLVLRLESMVLEAVALPVGAIRRQIAAAVDLIIQVRRLNDGSRRIVCIAEVAGYDEDTGEVIIENIYELKPPVSRLAFTGYLPSFMTELVGSGGLSLDEMFT